MVRNIYLTINFLFMAFFANFTIFSQESSSPRILFLDFINESSNKVAYAYLSKSMVDDLKSNLINLFSFQEVSIRSLKVKTSLLKELGQSTPNLKLLKAIANRVKFDYIVYGKYESIVNTNLGKDRVKMNIILYSSANSRLYPSCTSTEVIGHQLFPQMEDCSGLLVQSIKKSDADKLEQETEASFKEIKQKMAKITKEMTPPPPQKKPPRIALINVINYLYSKHYKNIADRFFKIASEGIKKIFNVSTIEPRENIYPALSSRLEQDGLEWGEAHSEHIYKLGIDYDLSIVIYLISDFKQVELRKVNFTVKLSFPKKRKEFVLGTLSMTTTKGDAYVVPPDAVVKLVSNKIKNFGKKK